MNDERHEHDHEHEDEVHTREHHLMAEGAEQELHTEPVAEEVIRVPGEGLEQRPQPQKRVIIIGGGIAGLVAAFELARQGHEPLVLEAQHRVGGRVYTLRDWAPGLYIEAGAMRIPRVHDLTLE
ncbi:MAG TPA: FAD-dependent oxidoreductase, partial [Actinomycetota bacterium]|nr:FAD-dependent oxidoreductase [Actinomycetota bacterium]